MNYYEKYRSLYPFASDAKIIDILAQKLDTLELEKSSRELHNKFEEQAKSIARLTQDYEEIQYDLKQMKLDRESSRGFFKDIPKLVKPTGE
jgi:hypothetical protein